MSTQKNKIQTIHGIKIIKHSDHFAAMKELEERMLRFAGWYHNLAFNSDIKSNGISAFLSVQEALQYWIDNVDNKS